MRAKRIGRIACVAALLLLCFTYADRSVGSVPDSSQSLSSTHAVSLHTEGDATFSAPGADLLDIIHETNRVALPSSPIHLYASWRTLHWGDTLLRMIRLVAIGNGRQSIVENIMASQCHEISSLRFRIGYFIYHRCQMRC